MKLHINFTSVIVSFILMVAVSLVMTTPALAEGPTIDHRFFLELPDGSKVEIKGPKIHRASDDGTTAQVGSHCRYQEFIDAGKEVNVQRDVSSGYHCSTNESCFTKDYGAPFLPRGFNSTEAVYTDFNASYFAFYNKTFTQMLKEKAPYYVSLYDPLNIRGFAGAKWVGNVDWEVDTGGTIQILSDPPNPPLGLREWGTIPGFDAKQSWGSGEVYLNTEGGNVLQGKITWTLKLPAQKSLACIAISPAGKPAWNPETVKKGDILNFNCAVVEGAKSYEFRVIEPDQTTVNLASAGAGILPTQIVSAKYAVSKVGTHYAQCRVCADGTCTAWENVSDVRQRDE